MQYNKANYRHHRGFSLIELIIVIAILGIIANFATTNFRDMVLKTSMTSGVNNFIGALQLAKSESVARIAPVSLCKRNLAGNACVTAADTAANTTERGWAQGWIIFTDADKDGNVDTADGDTLLFTQSKFSPELTFIGTATAAEFINFNAAGLSSISSSETLIMCNGQVYDDRSKGVVITTLGRGSAMRASDTSQTSCLIPVSSS